MKSKIIYWGLLLVSILVMIFSNNDILKFLSLLLFITVLLIEEVKNRVDIKKVIKDLDENNTYYIKIKSYTPIIVSIIYILIAITNFQNIYNYKVTESILNNTKEINSIIDFLFSLDMNDKIFVITDAMAVIIAIIFFVKNFICTGIISEEGIIFSGKTYVKYSDIKSLKYRETFFSSLDKSKVVKIKYKKFEYVLKVKEEEFREFVEYLENKTGLEFIYTE